MTVSVSLLFRLSIFLLAWECRLTKCFQFCCLSFKLSKIKISGHLFASSLAYQCTEFFFFFFLTCTHTQKTKMSDLNHISLTECKGRQGVLRVSEVKLLSLQSKQATLIGLESKRLYFTAQAWINNTCFFKRKKED